MPVPVSVQETGTVMFTSSTIESSVAEVVELVRINPERRVIVSSANGRKEQKTTLRRMGLKFNCIWYDLSSIKACFAYIIKNITKHTANVNYNNMLMSGGCQEKPAKISTS